MNWHEGFHHIVNFNNLPTIILHHSPVKQYHTILHPASETQFEKPNKIPEVKTAQYLTKVV